MKPSRLTDIQVIRARAHNESLREVERDSDADTDAFLNEISDTKAPFWTVAIYLCDRAYGGPEEGGWWYTCGQRVDTPIDGINLNDLLTSFTGEGTVYRDTADQSAAEQEAHAYAELLQTQLDATVNRGRRPIDSVLSEGVYCAEVHPGEPPAFYPATRPHYE